MPGTAAWPDRASRQFGALPHAASPAQAPVWSSGHRTTTVTQTVYRKQLRPGQLLRGSDP
jgi:hypothetical protein